MSHRWESDGPTEDSVKTLYTMCLQACVCSSVGASAAFSDCVIGQEKAGDNWIHAKVSSGRLLLDIRFTRYITNRRLLCLSEQQEVGLRQR